jgi:hypothetical protein
VRVGERILAKEGVELVDLLSGHARLEAVVEIAISDLAAGSDRGLERVELAQGVLLALVHVVKIASDYDAILVILGLFQGIFLHL